MFVGALFLFLRLCLGKEKNFDMGLAFGEIASYLFL